MKKDKVKKEKGSFKKTVKNNVYILKTIRKYSKWFIPLTALEATTHSIIIFLQHFWLLKVLIDCIQNKAPYTEILNYIVFVFVLVVIKYTIQYFYANYFKSKEAEKVYRGMRMTVYRKAVEIDIEKYDDPEFYNECVWSMNECAGQLEKTRSNIWRLFWNVTNILTTGVFIAVYNVWGLAFVALSFALNFWGNKKYNSHNYELDRELNPKYRKLDYMSRVFYLKDYVKELRLSNVRNKLSADYNETYGEISETVKKHSKWLMIWSFLTNYAFSVLLINGIYIVFLLYMAYKGEVTAGAVATLFLASRRLDDNLRGLSYTIPQFGQNSKYIEKMRTFLELTPDIVSPEKCAKIENGIGGFTLTNVSFAYPGNEQDTLKNVSIDIKPGEKIAIVGHNGAGKTTLVNLLLRLYDPSEGEIIYAGNDIKSYDVEQYRSLFGVAFQDFQIFAGTVFDNIKMDVCETDTERFEEANRKSGFEEKLTSLADGGDTYLTREFGDGVELSGGEAQKLALSRIFYKDSKCIIMDEPSSALDPISEAHLNDTILNYAEGRTIIFISHRLSTTRVADRIFYMENGEIVESGSHDELMDLNGKYAYMFNLQAEEYKKGQRQLY